MMKIQSYNLKPTRKKIRSFLHLLISRLNRRYADQPHSTGYNTFEEWMAQEMQLIDNRYKLCQLLYKIDPEANETAQTTLNKCIEAIRNSVDFVNADFDFEQNNQKVWTATPKFDTDNKNCVLEPSKVAAIV